MTRSKNNIFIVLMIILAIMLFLRDIFSIEINRFFFVGYIVISFMLLSIENLVSFFFFLIPLFCGLPGNFIYPVFIIIFVYKTKRINISTLAIFAVFALLELFASMFVQNLNFIDLVSYLSCFLIFLLILMNDDLTNSKKVLLSFFVGLLLFSIICFVSTIKNAPPNWLELFSKGWFRFGDTVNEDSMHIRANANDLGMYEMLGISCGFYFLNQKFKHKLLIISGMFFMLILGILSMSRTFFLSLVIFMILYFLISAKKLKTKLFFVVGIFVMFLFGISLIGKYPEIYEGLLTRFSDDTIATGGDRISIFNMYSEAFFSNGRVMILGSGVVGYKSVMGIEYAMHNMIQQIFVCYGFVGGVILTCIIVRRFVYKFKESKSITWLPAIVAILFCYQANQFINPWVNMFPLLVLFIPLLMSSCSTGRMTQ